MNCITLTTGQQAQPTPLLLLPQNQDTSWDKFGTPSHDGGTSLFLYFKACDRLISTFNEPEQGEKALFLCNSYEGERDIFHIWD